MATQRKVVHELYLLAVPGRQPGVLAHNDSLRQQVNASNGKT